jgi:hypothetical protein
MPLPFAILAVPLFLGAVALYVVLVNRAFRRLRRTLAARGYKSPAALAAMSGVVFVLPLVLTFAYTAAAGPDTGLWFALAAMLAVPLGFSSAVRLLPARSARTAGRRVSRLPYARMGKGLLATCALLVVAGAATGQQIAFQLLPVVFAAAATCLGIARRLQAADAAEVLARDTRPPVLYLRPFQGEEGIFVELPRKRREFLDDWRRNILRRESEQFLTLERYLADEITRVIGPFVALGNPVDFAPPSGAARMYLADDEWTSRFTDLAPRAACVIAVPGGSAQLAWELERLHAMNLHQRLFVLTQPGPVQQARSARSRARSWWVRALTKPPGARDAAPAAWSTFARVLRQAGYDAGAADPGPGAVVGFDAEARAVVLARELRGAAETVQTMRAHLRSTSPAP